MLLTMHAPRQSLKNQLSLSLLVSKKWVIILTLGVPQQVNEGMNVFEVSSILPSLQLVLDNNYENYN